MATKWSLMISRVSSGNQLPVWSKDFLPAKTSVQATFFWPEKALSTAASKTAWAFFQMSKPTPSPSIKGMMGWSGTTKRPFSNTIFSAIISP